MDVLRNKKEDKLCFGHADFRYFWNRHVKEYIALQHRKHVRARIIVFEVRQKKIAETVVIDIARKW